MKIFATIIAATSLLTLGALAQVSQNYTPTAKDIKIEKISVDTNQTSPEIKADKFVDKRAKYEKWLEIEVEFSLNMPANFEVVDELTFEYLVEINNKLYSGTVTHVNIPKGKSLFSVMYMSPRAIHRATGGKDLTSGAVSNVWVTINKNGGLLAKKNDKAGEPVAAKQRTPGLLVAKNETPFAPFWWDRYEAIKPLGR